MYVQAQVTEDCSLYVHVYMYMYTCTVCTYCTCTLIHVPVLTHVPVVHLLYMYYVSNVNVNAQVCGQFLQRNGSQF